MDNLIMRVIEKCMELQELIESQMTEEEKIDLLSKDKAGTGKRNASARQSGGLKLKSDIHSIQPMKLK